MSNLIKEAHITVEMAVHWAFHTHDIDLDNSTIRKACRLRKIKGAYKIGKTWWMPPSTFEAWLLDADAHRSGPRVKKR